MQIINIHEAKTHLSHLVEEAAQGNTFIIAKAGKPIVKVSPLSEEEYTGVRRLGFMSGEFAVPDETLIQWKQLMLPGFLKEIHHEIVA